MQVSDSDSGIISPFEYEVCGASPRTYCGIAANESAEALRDEIQATFVNVLVNLSIIGFDVSVVTFCVSAASSLD
jgi:hypothetical protein